MRAGAPVIGVSMLVAALVCAAQLHPFLATWHGWAVDLAVALAGAFGLSSAARSASAQTMHERCAAIAGVGGALLAAAFVYADIVGGAPVRVPAAPGQDYVPEHYARIGVSYPDAGEPAGVRVWPTAATIRDGDKTLTLSQGDVVRAGPFVFTAVRWPIARVTASDTNGRPVTTTQPNNVAFLSPYLTFPQVDTDTRPVDFFSVPPLHRDVGVKYFDGLPARGITVPFLVLQIREANGAALFDGVAVDGREITSSGVRLRFSLGTYPAVISAGAAPIWICALGIALAIGGFVGYAFSLPKKEKRPEP
ncbi:MAG TPA: hypothetical protein VKT51_12535 [Candidatus Eremiobacteraceae bacterium]|nr:hypothetical protein [Candidatus Eremiobacteraceae bacterium]